MENAENVTQLPLPRTIVVPSDPGDLALTPREMREVKIASGQRLDYLFQEADLDEKVQLMVWIILRRQGYEVTWDQALDVSPVPGEADDGLDPTNAAS